MQFSITQSTGLSVGRDARGRQTEERFREDFAKARDALEDAANDSRCKASDMAFRVVASTVTPEKLELAVPAKVDGDPTTRAAAFSPPAPTLKDFPPAGNKGRRTLNLLKMV